MKSPATESCDVQNLEENSIFMNSQVGWMMGGVDWVMGGVDWVMDGVDWVMGGGGSYLLYG